jgi:hypothetical protein
LLFPNVSVDCLTIEVSLVAPRARAIVPKQISTRRTFFSTADAGWCREQQSGVSMKDAFKMLSIATSLTAIPVATASVAAV